MHLPQESQEYIIHAFKLIQLFKKEASLCALTWTMVQFLFNVVLFMLRERKKNRDRKKRETAYKTIRKPSIKICSPLLHIELQLGIWLPTYTSIPGPLYSQVCPCNSVLAQTCPLSQGVCLLHAVFRSFSLDGMMTTRMTWRTML